MDNIFRHLLVFIIISFLLIGCTGDSIVYSTLVPTTDEDTPIVCGNTSMSTYTISWDSITDDDLLGYKVYYGDNPELTKDNALGSYDTTSNSADFSPSEYGFTICTLAYISVTSIGSTKPESPLSSVQPLIIN